MNWIPWDPAVKSKEIQQWRRYLNKISFEDKSVCSLNHFGLDLRSDLLGVKTQSNAEKAQMLFYPNNAASLLPICTHEPGALTWGSASSPWGHNDFSQEEMRNKLPITSRRLRHITCPYTFPRCSAEHLWSDFITAASFLPTWGQMRGREVTLAVRPVWVWEERGRTTCQIEGGRACTVQTLAGNNQVPEVFACSRMPQVEL